jgi:flagellar biosynthesis protein FlhG
MHEVTHKIDQAEHLRTLVLNQKSFDPSTMPNVWTVTSGKGGVGKSVVALNLAMLMANQGKKVLLVDADENLGKLDVMCNVDPHYRLSDIVMGKADVQECAITIAEDLWLLAGNSGSLVNAEVSDSDRQYFIDRVIHSQSHITDIIFDTGAGVNSAVLQYASAAHNVIIVSHHEPTAVMDAYATIKLILANRISALAVSSFQLIMNNSITPTESDVAASKLQTAVEHFLRVHLEYLGSIPSDEHVSRSIREQSPLVERFPHSAFGLSLHAISHRLLHSRSVFQQQTNELVLA